MKEKGKGMFNKLKRHGNNDSYLWVYDGYLGYIRIKLSSKSSIQENIIRNKKIKINKQNGYSRKNIIRNKT
jgi:hypothetical protein